jgi:hypothetical protein
MHKEHSLLLVLDVMKLSPKDNSLKVKNIKILKNVTQNGNITC